MFMNSDFKVRSDATDYPAYGTSDAGFPQNKWCIYTDKIIAARYSRLTK